MKKAGSIILTLALVLTIIPFNLFTASTAGTILTDGAYTYELLGSTPNYKASIKGFTGGDEIIIIPASLGGYPVTSIGADAFKDRMGIKSITLPSDLTSIGTSAFYRCTGLSGIVIPDNVTSIGTNAFYECTGLQNITIGAAVTTIGNSAFQGCTGISMLTIPDNVTSLGTGVFSGCTGIVTAVIGKGISTVGSKVFYGCTGMTAITIGSKVSNIDLTALQNCTGLTEIIVDENNLAYSSQGCVLFNKDQSILKQYLVNKTEMYTIPGTVTRIGYKAFENWTRLTGISMPSSVLYIDESAFAGCTGISSLNIGVSVSTIGKSAFSGCSGITSLTISGSVVSIGDSAFQNCIGLTELIIPNNVTTIGNSTFSGCLGITDVVIGNSVISIGTSAFAGCKALAGVVIGNGVKTIGASAFSTCIALKTVNIPDNVIVIGSKIFSGCTALTSATIGNGVGIVPVDTFKSCTSLTVIKIGYGVESIDFNAFTGVASLVELDVDDNNQVYSSRDCVLFNKDKTELIHYLYCPPASYTVPDSVVTIGNGAFFGFKQVSAITIPDSVQTIGTSAFSGCAGLTNLVIPNGVTIINEKTFFGCTGLTNISLPTALTSIGISAFNGCAKLASIQIPETVTTIYSSAFAGCVSLAALAVPDKVTAIGTSAFSGCKALKAVSLPNSITSIAEKTFYQCTSLASFTIPDSVTNIGVSAFSGCSSLSEIKISNNATNIGNSAFLGCVKLTQIVIPDSVTIIGDSAFSGCTGLAKVFLGSQVTSIGASAFKGCAGLTKVVFPFSVSAIGANAFQNCTKISAAYFFGSAPKMGTLVFSGCATGFKVYYLSTATGFSNPWNTYTTTTFLPVTDITFSPSTSAPTNGNVTLAINYFLDAYTEEYKVDGGDWINYTVPLILTTNCTVSARCKDALGNITDSSTIVVSNIDKTPPIAPAFSANPTTQTSGNVNVTITYPVDASVKEYKIGTGAWTAYTTAIVLTANNTVFARCADAVGNISAVTSIVVSNIYLTALPVLTANPSTPTKGNVSVTITYPVNTTARQYKIGAAGTWTVYTTAVVLSANNTVYARCSDAVGNISGTSSLLVSNIDKTPPAAPTIAATPSAPTIGSVTVTVTYPVDATIKEYKIGFGAWTAYTAPIVLTANNNVDARCKDAAGNLSVTTSAVITNIAEAPGVPVGLKAVSASYNSIKANWNTVAGATKYYIYRSDSLNGTYTYVTSTTRTYTTDTSLTTGKTYYYKVKARLTVGAINYDSALTAAVSTKPMPSTPAGLKAVSASYNSIKVSWNAVDGATKYYIYRSDSLNGTYTYVTSTTRTTTTNASLTTGKTYYYKVKARLTIGGIDYDSALTAAVSAKPIPTPTGLKAVSASKNSIKVSWNAVDGATKYYIYRSDSLNGTYTYVTSTTRTTTTNTSLTTGKTYYYKVKARLTVGSVNYDSALTAAVSAKPQ
jgi:fibronectin type 3 domain-containing protein